MSTKSIPQVKCPDSDKPEDAKTIAPPSLPSPPMDGKQPIPAGDLEVEKFLISTDTEGGD